MLGKQSTNFAVACLLAGATNAVLNSEDINAYQEKLAEERANEGHGQFENHEAKPLYKPSHRALHGDNPHPGIKIFMDRSLMGTPAPTKPQQTL